MSNFGAGDWGLGAGRGQLGPEGPRRTALLGLLSLVPFVLLATANSAGYRYGASDLAFYGPAVMRQLDPDLFPRDRPVLDAQANLTFMDETVAAVARRTTTHLPSLFLGLYVVALVLLAAAVTAIGTTLYRHWWTVLALLAAFTIRHAITKSGTNSLEGYFHPRQLAFAFGIIAIATFLRGRPLLAALALVGAGSLHPTTTLWFAVWLAVAIFATARVRWPFAVVVAALGIVGWWAFAFGPLAGRLTLMDPEWLEALAGKDYLFPLRWPLAAWLANLAYVPVIVLAYRRRAASGLTSRAEQGMVIGCLALVAVFFVALVLNGLRVALAIQLQPARIFWMLDFTATVYLVWALAEGGLLPRPPSRFVLPAASVRPASIAAVLAVLALARGIYVMRVEFPTRPLFGTAVPGDWGRVAAWVQSTPKDTGWLADPMHAVHYGTSLRMAAARDVFVEGTKDAAIGMYDRTIAFRTRDRLHELEDFSALSVEQIQALGHRYGLGYFITEQQYSLPIAFEAGAIRIYRIP